MAARTVRCFFKNMTDLPLVRLSDEKEKLPHGIYTDPWYPPQTIAAGAVGEWRTESNGFMTGTEGRARYRIGSDHVALWWDNPFIGRNDSSIRIVQEFGGDDSKVFEGANTISGYPPPHLESMKDGEIVAWIAAFLFPPVIFANASMAGDATAIFAIRRKARVSSPLFGPQGSGPRSSRINMSQKPGEWQGLWTGNAVSVTLSHLGGGSMSANITDTTPQAPLQLQETFSLGLSNWVFNVFALAVQRDLGSGDREAVSALIRAGVNTIQSQRPTEHEPGVTEFRDVIQAELSKHRFEIPEAIVERGAKVAASVARVRRSTVMLSQGVCLTLYDDFEAGQKVGGHMLYQRMHLGFDSMLANERLTFYPILS